MSKKSGFTVFALTILAGAVVMLGMRHVENEQEDMLKKNNPNIAVEVKETSEEGTEPESSIKEMNPESLSLEEFLTYQAETNGEARLVYYGDVSLDRPSISEWNEELQTDLGDSLVIEDMAYPGYDTYELYIQRTTDAIAEANPDAVLFFLPAYPDKERDLGLQESEQYFRSVINGIRTASPETLLIAVEPHLMGGEALEWNSRSLDYVRYLDIMREVLSEEEVPVFELHKSFEQIESREQLYAENEMDLNEEGERTYLQFFNEWTEQKLDTSSIVD